MAQDRSPASSHASSIKMPTAFRRLTMKNKSRKAATNAPAPVPNIPVIANLSPGQVANEFTEGVNETNHRNIQQKPSQSMINETSLPSTLDNHLSNETFSEVSDAPMKGNDSSPASSSHNMSYQNSRQSATLVRSSIDLAAADVNRHADRDRYGFKKKTNFVSEKQYDDWWESYVPYLQRRKRKWVKLMQESGLNIENDTPTRFPAKSEKLKRYIRKGIPAEWRGNAWWWYSKGPEMLSSHPDLYEKLCKETQTLKNNDTELIERDLNRTFPDNIYFRADKPTAQPTNDQETPLISALRRVLRAFSVYQPAVGYCQSLNFLSGLLLLFMDEEKAFWMLVIITQRYLPGIHEVSLEGVNVEQGVLMLFVKQLLPEMWEKIGVNFDGRHYDNVIIKLPPITLCTASWFMSGFISILPTECMLRVWDCFLFEDAKIFFRVALTVLRLAEPDTRHLHDQMDVFQTIQNYPKGLIDPSIIMEGCFKRSGRFSNVSTENIARLRLFVTERRKKAEQAAHENIIVNGSMNNQNPEETGYAGISTSDLEAFTKSRIIRPAFQVSVVRRMKSRRD